MNSCNMEDVAFWGTCEPQPLQQVGMFNGAESQASLLPCNVESPFPQYWPQDQWRADDISDIALITVDPVAYNHVLGHAAETMHDPPVGSSKFTQQGQWGGHADFYPAHDVQEILNASYMSINSPTLSSPHLSQDLSPFNKSFGTITPVHQSRPINVPYGGSSSLPFSNRPVSSSNAPPYVVSPVSMGMFPPANVSQRIISTSGMDEPRNGMLQHVPKLLHPMRIAAKAGVNGAVVDIPGAPVFGTNLKSSILSPFGESSSHRRSTVAEEPKMASFNPGPYVNSARALVPIQKQQEDAHRMWLDNNTRGKSCAVPVANSRHGQQQHQQAMSSSSPVMNLGSEQRPMSNSSPAMGLGYDQRSMSNSSPVASMARHPKSLNNSSPSTRMVFGSKQPMTSSSPVPTVMGFELSPQRQPMASSPVPIMSLQQQQPPMTSSSSVPIMGLLQHQTPMTPNPVNDFEARQQPQPMVTSSSTPNLCTFEHNQQPTMSTSPPLSNLSYEPRQPAPAPAPPPPMGSSPSTSNLVFEPMRQQSNSSTPPNLARQQAAGNTLRPDSGESASKWSSLRIVGGVPVSEKAPIMRQQPEAGTIKCALPRSSSANFSPAANVPSVVNKRPLWADDNKNNQGGSMNKKPMQKWQGAGACSRLEEISAAAHQKVTQNTSGRALGPALNTNLKPRARQGSANDPQSIAARVRRERISERLKVLQTLIPNGDKVDMVTMLEKAINYVQCLEVQIRMLKNDSLWPKALGPLPNTLEELLELAGPEFLGDKDVEEMLLSERATITKKTAPEVIEFDGNQPSTDKE